MKMNLINVLKTAILPAMVAAVLLFGFYSYSAYSRSKKEAASPDKVDERIRAHFSKAREAASNGKYDEAIKAYKKVLVEKPELKEVNVAIALMYRAKGDVELVKSYCNKVAADESIKQKKAFQLACIS